MLRTIQFRSHIALINRYISTCSELNVKDGFRKDSGVRRRVRALEMENHNPSEVFEEEEDLDDLETDFANVDNALGQHKMEVRKRKDHIGKMMTVKKYFSKPKPPNMLTWAERQEIKNLHANDPEEWSVDVLCESFPAVRETITKILKSKWTPENIEKIKRRDELVRENWRRLAAGKLDAEPEVLEHLKKFVGRREEYLEAISDGSYAHFLPKPKEEKWSNGPMSSILESYEKKLLELDQKTSIALQEGCIDDGSRLNGAVLGKRNEEIGQFDKKDTNLNDRRPVTLALLRQALKDRVSNQVDPSEGSLFLINSSESGGERNQSAVASTKNEGGHREKKRTPEAFTVTQVSKNKKSLREEDEEKPRTVKAKFQEEDISYNLPSPFKDKCNTENFANRDVSVNEKSLHQETVMNRPLHQEPVRFSQKSEKRRPELEIGEGTHRISSPSESEPAEDHQLVDFSGNEKSFQEETTVCNYKSEMERQEFEKEERSIDGTFFWSSKEESKMPVHVSTSAAATTRKPSASGKTAMYNYNYPEKINVPKGKRGSGLTFQVKDCFYDDDGEFLYRVPGITPNVDPVRGK